MRTRKFPLWTLLGVVLVIALLVGGGVFSSSPPTRAQRATAIESVIRCPSCEDLSVADSSAPTAITVRAAVVRLIAQGQSDQQIKDYLVARYGSAVVLEPPTSGWSTLVWVLPVVGGVLAVALVAVVLVRRRRSGAAALDDDLRGPTVDPAAVEERRRFLSQSLADADAEYLAGDLADADYLELRHRDLARLAALGSAPAPASAPLPASPASTSPAAGAVATAVGTKERPGVIHSSVEADAAGPATGPVVTTAAADTRRRGRNRWFLAGAIVCFVAALGVAVPVFSSNRLPGQTATGSVALSPSQQVARTLDQAAAEENSGQLGEAAQLYQQVLTAHPGNEVALAQLGWLEYKVGQQGADATLLSDARAKLTQAVALTPGDYAAHLYLGTLLLQLDGNAGGAVTQFRQFLAADPPATVVSQAAVTLRQAYTSAGAAVPASVPAA